MTVVTRKMMESDLKMIWDSIANNDYIIPSVLSVMKVYFRFSLVIIVSYALLACFVVRVYGEVLGFYNDLLFSSFCLFFLLFVLGLIFYSYASQYACIENLVKDKSIFFKCAKMIGVRIFVCCTILFYLSVFLAMPLVKECVIDIFPFSLLFISVIGMVMFSVLMSRYMTPGVISILKSIQEHLSKPQSSF